VHTNNNNNNNNNNILWNEANKREKDERKNTEWENKKQHICVLLLIGRVLFMDTTNNP